jgi:hypothetical protein
LSANGGPFSQTAGAQTVEKTVRAQPRRSYTPLKWGVNEKLCSEPPVASARPGRPKKLLLPQALLMTMSAKLLPPFVLVDLRLAALFQ